MAQEPNAVEQAVSRALRENLERIQVTANDLHHAINDVVAACGSNKPTNALPPMLRAQASAASLSAALDVLSRFVASSLQLGPRSPLEAQISSMISAAAPAGVAPPEPAPHVASPPRQAAPPPPPPSDVEEVLEPEELAPEPEPVAAAKPAARVEIPAEPEPEPEADFDVNQLSTEEQELHRRANRVAKVSMQDIKMLRPEQVRLGREKKDICNRLKEDIEKAHREYDRRFKPIMDHPVDYFYRWMVEILADGDASALGEYPYATPSVTARR
ncbi:MAG TPA: hypothetical protein VJP87_00600 [Candidatus Acidoferrales bacterium]|nr:hypothetical protein [Candidatus Acidoferrales bacterium]